MKETDIRPDELRDGQQEAVRQDIEWLLQRRSDFVHVECPACGRLGVCMTFEKRGFTYDECRKCHTVYQSPRPSPEMLGEFYAQSKNAEYWNQHYFPASEKVRLEKIHRPRAVNIAWSRPAGTVIDVGAGYGTFLQAMAEYDVFMRLIALEPSPKQAEVCRSKGFEVIEKPFERLGDFRANCITAFESIEHLFAPAKFLMKCHEILGSKGLLVLTCPNIKGFDVQTLGVLSSTISHEHLNYFHPASLKSLVETCGFDVIELTTPGKLDAELVRKQILQGDYQPEPFIEQMLIDRWEEVGANFQKFLADNLLSSHMWLVARKK